LGGSGGRRLDGDSVMDRDTKDSMRAVLAFFGCLALTGGAMLMLWVISDLLKMVIQ